MPMPVCLQGGAEFQPGCESMDSAMIAAGRESNDLVVIAPFAGRPGRERRIAGENARRWYLGLGASRVEVAQEEGAGFDELLDGAGLLVLPGGSPQRLLEALQPSADALESALHRTAISGASAGAMVLCRWTVLPGVAARVVPGLALVPVDLVLPHYGGGSRWLGSIRKALPRSALVLGLPERSGVVIGSDGSFQPVGVNAFSEVGLHPLHDH